MNRSISLGVFIAIGLSLFSCGGKVGESQLKRTAVENGVEWTIIKQVIGNSRIKVTEEGEPTFLVSGQPFYSFLLFQPSGILDFRQVHDSLSFEDYEQLKKYLIEQFGTPLYSGDQDLLLQLYHDLNQDKIPTLVDKAIAFSTDYEHASIFQIAHTALMIGYQSNYDSVRIVVFGNR